jgi:hypothetical protein
MAIAVLEGVPPDAGLQIRTNFSTLIVGLAGTWDQTRVTEVASSGENRSTIRYDFSSSLFKLFRTDRHGMDNGPRLSLCLILELQSELVVDGAHRERERERESERREKERENETEREREGGTDLQPTDISIQPSRTPETNFLLLLQ